MVQKGSYLKEREYFTDTQGGTSENMSGKIQYWESILGKEKLSQIAGENEKIRFHLDGVPFTVPGQKNLRIETQDIMPVRETGYLKGILEELHPMFAPFYQGILQEGLLRFRQRKGKGRISCSGQVEKDLVRYALERLQKVSVRTLILEMRQLKADGGLCGNDGAEEYQDFLCRYLSDTSYLYGLYERYPLLFRIMEEQMEQCVDYFCEIMEHLEADREAIGTQLLGGRSVTGLRSIRCMQGDVHGHGRSAACVYLDGTAEVFYKPHSLENEMIFQNLLKRISEKYSLWDVHMGLKIISRPDYGWEEKISSQECTDEEGIKRFYERAGMQIFLAYLFGTADLHCENMIARGEYPVLIDLETLIHLQERDVKSDEVFQSVLRSGILPAYLPDGRGIGNDVGALSGEGGKQGRMLIPVIQDAYTSQMKVGYRYGSMGHTQNRVTYQGKPVQAGKYMEDVIHGFEKAYECVKSNTELQDMILKLAETCESRHVVSDTMKYAALLNSSYHPDLLEDGGDRELFLHSIGAIGKTRNQRLAECEAEAMLRGDIPYFYSKGKRLMCEGKICIRDYFASTPRQAVQSRIARLSQRDEHFQVKLIRLSVTIAGKLGMDMVNSGQKRKDSQRDAMGREYSDTAILSICEKIAGLILDNVYEDEDGKLQILSIDMLEQSRSKIRRVSQYFYEGTAGIALFLYALEREKARMRKGIPDKEGKIWIGKKVAGRLLGQLKEYTENLSVSEETPEVRLEGFRRTGLFDGEFSIVFAYLLLYEIGKEEQYLQLAKLHTENILPLIQKDKNFDLLGGNAGGIITLLKLYDITGDEAYLKTAEAAGDTLCSHAKKMESGIGWPGPGEAPLCGMAHGNSGIMTAFARLYQKTGNRRFYEACLQCLDYEDSLYAEESHDWKDLREEAVRFGHADSHEMSWCHGAGGAALSRLLAIEALSKAEEERLPGKTEEDVGRILGRLEKDIKKAIPGLEEHFLRQGMCLCHGTLGNYRILKKLQGYLDGQKMDRVKSDVYAQILRLEKEEPDLLAQEYHSPGFMNGLAGIGYYLLKEIDERLPDILEL